MQMRENAVFHSFTSVLKKHSTSEKVKTTLIGTIEKIRPLRRSFEYKIPK